MLSWKIPQFCSVGGARSKNSIFRVFRVPFDYPAHSYRKQFYPKPVVPMESRDSGGVPFPVWRVCDQALADIDPWKVTITKNENLHIDTRRKIRWFQKAMFSIYDEKITISRENRFRTVASPGACERLAVSNRRSSSIHRILCLVNDMYSSTYLKQTVPVNYNFP